MNGRIYDPVLGRFLQADPFVQAPRNGQSLNRFSYGFNNPLSGTDPTGYVFGIDDLLAAFIFNSFVYTGYQLVGRPQVQQTIPEQEKLLENRPVPGVLSAAFGSGMSQEHRNLFTQTSPVAATVGNTSTEQTGRKFTNGAGASAFAYAIAIPAGEGTLVIWGSRIPKELVRAGKYVFPIARGVGGVIGGILIPRSTGGCGSHGCLDELPAPPGTLSGNDLSVILGPTVMHADVLSADVPGKPTEADGFKEPKRHAGNKDGKVKNPNGPGTGWVDKDGKVWVPTGPGGSIPGTTGAAHGGPHWDVQDPRTGTHTNIYPGGRKR